MRETITLIYILGPLALVVVGIVAGGLAERRHLRDLALREREAAGVLLTDVRAYPGGADPRARPALVTAEVVIASDYFKNLAASLRNLFGGEMRAYLMLLTRARREALLRLQEEARRRGFDAVCNVRLEAPNIGGTPGSAKIMPMATMMASGTAYRRAPRG